MRYKIKNDFLKGKLQALFDSPKDFQTVLQRCCNTQYYDDSDFISLRPEAIDLTKGLINLNISVCKEEIEALEDPDFNEWTSYSKYEPEENGWYLITVHSPNNGKLYTAADIYEDGYWDNFSGDEIVAFKKMPPCYKPSHYTGEYLED